MNYWGSTKAQLDIFSVANMGLQLRKRFLEILIEFVVLFVTAYKTG